MDLDDTDNPGPFLRTCLRMDTTWDYLESSPAKHVLLIADACYSGLLTRSRGGEKISDALLETLAARRAMQVITAGSKGEVAVELPRFGHGAFTYKLLEELKARAASPGQVFTTTDLYAALQRSVGVRLAIEPYHLQQMTAEPRNHGVAVV